MNVKNKVLRGCGSAAVAFGAASAMLPAQAFADEGSGVAAILPQMDEFIPMLVAFIILWIILAKFGWPLFEGMLVKRETTIKDALEQSENARVESERVLAEYKRQLATLGLGLEDRMTSKVGLLSGGQRQALTLLMATLVTPKLLLLDEHTAALDPATAEKVLDLTKSIVAEKKITCLMVTHNMHQALELGNRTLMMDAGRIVFDVKGEARSKMTVDDLLEKFHENAGKILDNDRILLSKVEANN